jgi:hypothetical protein
MYFAHSVIKVIATFFLFLFSYFDLYFLFWFSFSLSRVTPIVVIVDNSNHMYVYNFKLLENISKAFKIAVAELFSFFLSLTY